jgi:hypothetical protein
MADSQKPLNVTPKITYHTIQPTCDYTDIGPLQPPPLLESYLYLAQLSVRSKLLHPKNVLDAKQHLSKTLSDMCGTAKPVEESSSKKPTKITSPEES